MQLHKAMPLSSSRNVVRAAKSCLVCLRKKSGFVLRKSRGGVHLHGTLSAAWYDCVLHLFAWLPHLEPFRCRLGVLLLARRTQLWVTYHNVDFSRLTLTYIYSYISQMCLPLVLEHKESQQVWSVTLWARTVWGIEQFGISSVLI